MPRKFDISDVPFFLHYQFFRNVFRLQVVLIFQSSDLINHRIGRYCTSQQQGIHRFFIKTRGIVTVDVRFYDNIAEAVVDRIFPKGIKRNNLRGKFIE
ncbi:hypothetical protein SDC9_146822 [bioreactor metagenome]|uniref:Uncharacterized protein n=1 Tax=bioreactor metagenome TaxID=1076179 RepID=A0A645ECR1_9ZZZZ